jgi:predicted  nucleic acid-binding Zn-ribbon protein
MAKAEGFGDLLAKAGLDAVETTEHFAACRRRIAAEREGVKQAQAERRKRLLDLGIEKQEVEKQAKEVNDELVSLLSARATFPASA